ncbi:MAG: glycosyltransferase [Salegentibacter mishustinae]|nr:glycosyltransferase [Salegentibacter mishustinae]
MKAETKKLKIAFVVPSFPTTTETFIVNQICNLLDMGHEVTIFAISRSENFILHQNHLVYNLMAKTVYLKDFKVSKLQRYFYFLAFLLRNRTNIDFRKLGKMFNYKRHGKKAFNLRNFTKYRWILNLGKFDIFHAHFGKAGAYIADIKSFGFCANTPLVTSFHGYDIHPGYMSDYKKNYTDLFKEANLFTVNTCYTKSLLQELQPNVKIELLPVGLDTQKFKKQLSSPSPTFSILFVGRLTNFKAPDLAVKIINELIRVRGHKNISLCLVGEGEMRDHLTELIAQFDLQEYVEMKGAISQEEIIKLMAVSKLFLLPGIYDQHGRAETQGLVIQEAQAMELPVVVSNAGGMKYGLLDGETGFVIEEGNIEGYVDKIESLIKDEGLRKQMGQKGRRFVVDNYDSKVLGNKLQEFYSSLLS